MRAFYSEQDRVNALRAVVDSWRRTPFHDRARVKGAGVDCVNFVVAVYDETGFNHRLIVPDDYRVDQGSSLVRSRVIGAIEDSGSFEMVPFDGPESLIHGDCLCFKASNGSVEHHVGIVYASGTPRVRFASSLAPYGVTVLPLIDSTWRARLTVAFRPIES